MRTAWIIAAREVRERGRLFLICAGLALVPFAATLLPGARGNRADTIAVVGGFLALVLGLGLAITLGASTVMRDLAERRMSFYFTKPVSAPALWIGKAAAGLFVSLACFAIIVTPTMLAARRNWQTQWLGDIQPVLAGAVGIVVLFFVAHAMSTVIRSRSPLLALDFLFLVIAVAAMYLILRPLLLSAATVLMAIVAWTVALSVLIVLAVAPVWQLAKGRSDIRRSHAALMRFLWPAIAIVLLIVGGFVTWVVRVPLADLTVRQIDQPERGTSVIVTGVASNRFDYHVTFLLDRATKRFTRIVSPVWWGSEFSTDGRVAMWLRPVRTFPARELELYTAKGPTGIVLSPVAGAVLSGDGTRVAVANGSLLTVYELDTGKILASAAGLDGRARQVVLFLTPDLIRVIESEYRVRTATPLRVFDLDVRARKTTKLGERVLETAQRPVSVSSDGSRMLVRGANLIVDGRTLETIASLDKTPEVAHSDMLHDGRVVVIVFDHGPRLRLFDRDGIPRHEVAFPGEKNLWIVGEAGNGKLILGAWSKTMYVVDLTAGVIEHKLEGVRGPLPQWFEPQLTRFDADQEFVALDNDGKLVVWSVANPKPRPLL